MTICILGGTGFIGRHLCTALHLQGIAACVVSRRPDHQFLSRHAPSIAAVGVNDPALGGVLTNSSVLIDLASSSRPGSSPLDPSSELSHATWLSGFLARLSERNPSCHIVFASSGGQIYGAGHSRPIAESVPPAPATAYAFGKLTVENMLAFFSSTGQLSSTILRVANPVGLWQLGKGHGLVAAAIRTLDLDARLTIFGDGCNMRDYFDVDQLAQLLVRFADPGFRPKGIFNIGSGLGLTEREVVSVVEAVTGMSLEVTFAPARAFDLRYAVLDVARAKAELGWAPCTDLTKTVGKIVRRHDDLSS